MPFAKPCPARTSFAPQPPPAPPLRRTTSSRSRAPRCGSWLRLAPILARRRSRLTCWPRSAFHLVSWCRRVGTSSRTTISDKRLVTGCRTRSSWAACRLPPMCAPQRSSLSGRSLLPLPLSARTASPPSRRGTTCHSTRQLRPEVSSTLSPRSPNFPLRSSRCNALSLPFLSQPLRTAATRATLAALTNSRIVASTLAPARARSTTRVA